MITRTSIACLCLGSLLSHAVAEEYTVQEKPFTIKATLNGVLLPGKFEPIRIKPEAWADFTITSLVSQGAQVKKGDTLIGIDTRALDKQIAALEEARKTDVLNLAQAKQDLAQLEISTPRQLADHERAEKEAAENLQWYQEIGHAQEIETTKRSVKRAELGLAYQQEELKQLLKMYAEDDKTEETEEIILTRTRNAVERAEFAVKSAKINADHSLKTSIPRKLKSLQLAAENARIANASAKEKLPRALEQKRLAVALAVENDKKAVEKLAKLKADRAMMDIKAPADGIVYYGSLENGRWSPTGAVKVLRVGGKLPGNMTLMSFIPAGSPLQLSAFVAEKDLPSLGEGATGYAVSALHRHTNLPVTLSSVASYPEVDGTFRASLSLNLPEGIKLVPGMKATAHVTSKKLEQTLKIPLGYLNRDDNGAYTVKVKLADGKTEKRQITLGASNKDWVVVTQGLEKGQVIVK